MNIFDEALKSLEEAIEYEKGDTTKARAVIREISDEETMLFDLPQNIGNVRV